MQLQPRISLRVGTCTGALAWLAAFACSGASAQAPPAPQPAPAGANEWSCRPTAAHPRPVVLVHGTSANMRQSWSALSPQLKERGYCVFALNYGGGRYGRGSMYGLGPVAGSALELESFVDEVLQATGAAQVDIVGHSQGGMMPRYYLRFLNGAPKVNALIGIAPVNHGTTSAGFSSYTKDFPWAATLLGVWCPACADQLSGSAFMRKLNAESDTVPGVKYTVIATRYDDIVTPYDSQLLAGEQVTNIILQDICPDHRTYHEALVFDPLTLDLVFNALDPANPTPAVCD
jgi:triacylglycerol esterase/lipase EstA (alpha/beta hydrolase family)